MPWLFDLFVLDCEIDALCFWLQAEASDPSVPCFSLITALVDDLVLAVQVVCKCVVQVLVGLGFEAASCLMEAALISP